MMIVAQAVIIKDWKHKQKMSEGEEGRAVCNTSPAETDWLCSPQYLFEAVAVALCQAGRQLLSFQVSSALKKRSPITGGM